MTRTYDRVPQWDERNNDYPIRELLGGAVIQEKTWDLPETLDQGNQGFCVGYGWTHELLAEPVRITDEDPVSIYHQAQTLDEWPGEDYEGTSVLAGAKAVQKRGHMSEYRWATTLQDVLVTISAYGPVVIGVDWYEGMEDVDEHGFVHPTGKVVGGHCVCLIGITPSETDPYRWDIIGANSWGLGWGLGGRFKIGAHDLEKLLLNQGEVCVPVVRVPETPEPAPAPTPDPTPAPTPPQPIPPDPVIVPPDLMEILELFDYTHLSEDLQQVAAPFRDLALAVARVVTQRPSEQLEALRKLLESKDCAVRMHIPRAQ